MSKYHRYILIMNISYTKNNFDPIRNRKRKKERKKYHRKYSSINSRFPVYTFILL